MGRTIYDFLIEVFSNRKFLFLSGVFVIFFCAAGFVIHLSSEPGEKVIIFGIIEYIKKPNGWAENELNRQVRKDNDETQRLYNSSTKVGFELGQTVVAPFKSERCRHTGTITQIHGEKVIVTFPFNEQNAVDSKNIIPMKSIRSEEIQIGSVVYARFNLPTPTWVQAKVLQVKANNIVVKTDEKAKICGVEQSVISVSLNDVIPIRSQ